MRNKVRELQRNLYRAAKMNPERSNLESDTLQVQEKRGRQVSGPAQQHLIQAIRIS